MHIKILKSITYYDIYHILAVNSVVCTIWASYNPTSGKLKTLFDLLIDDNVKFLFYGVLRPFLQRSLV